MAHRPLLERISRITGRAATNARPLSGGCVGEVLSVTLSDGGRVVAKVGAGLEPEGWMLAYLAEKSRLPVPAVLHADDGLLLMEYVEAGDPLDQTAEAHAAELLAELHGIGWQAFGLERDTVIGGVPQPNPPTERWLDFFRDHRLLFMADQARRAGRLPAAVMARVERLAVRLDRWIEEPSHPSLIHGDAWGGNVLCHRGRVAAVIDPAIYYADAEIELAFGTLFSTFGKAFFRRYEDIRPIRPGFWEARRDLYNLYPLLVHVRLFGGGYVGSVERILDRFLG
ncbi:MAG: fructosamine kinase family protein [Magnetospirillum sp.]|nr:fructosamine kinase family protein [Magnetospirillum sp.]